MDTEMSAMPLGPSPGADTAEAAAEAGPAFDPVLAAPPPAAVQTPAAASSAPPLGNMGLPMPSQITAKQADALSKASNSNLGALVGKVLSPGAAPTGSEAASETTVELSRVTNTLIAQTDAAGAGQMGAAQSGAAQIAALSPPVTFLPGPDGKAVTLPDGAAAPGMPGTVQPNDPGAIGSAAVVQSVATTGASMKANAMAEIARQEGKSEEQVTADWANAFLTTYVELVKMLTQVMCINYSLAKPAETQATPRKRRGAPGEETSAPAPQAAPQAYTPRSRHPGDRDMLTGSPVQATIVPTAFAARQRAATAELAALAATATDTLTARNVPAATPAASEAVPAPIAAQAEAAEAVPPEDPAKAPIADHVAEQAVEADAEMDIDDASSSASDAQQIVQAAAATQARIAQHFQRPARTDAGARTNAGARTDVGARTDTILDREQQLRCQYEVLLAAAVFDLGMQSTTLSITRPGSTGNELSAQLSAELQLRRESRFGDGFGPNRKHASPLLAHMPQT